MNRRRFLGLATAAFGALLAPFRPGAEAGPKPWKTIPDARPRAHAQGSISGIWPEAIVAPGEAIRVGDPLVLNGDGRLTLALDLTRTRRRQYFVALESAPASREDRRVPVGMIA